MANHDIFISYTHEDAEAATRLARELAKRGWSVFWDRELLPGSSWRRQLEPALMNARVVLVLWSRKATESRWVEIEANHAFQRDAYIPASIDGAAPPLGLSDVQVANLQRWQADTNQPVPDVLIAALQGRLGPAAQAGAAPRGAASESDATAVTADGTIRLQGTASDGSAFELSIRLSQFRMRPEGLVIGRREGEADIVVPHASVSRRHALLVLTDGKVTASDLGSTNGTFVDERPALRQQPGELMRGTILRLGEVELRVDASLG